MNLSPEQIIRYRELLSNRLTHTFCQAFGWACGDCPVNPSCGGSFTRHSEAIRRWLAENPDVVDDWNK